jgi:signal transduction histidine kinase
VELVFDTRSRILIVDDEPTNLDVLEALLDAHLGPLGGCECIRAEDGRQALELAAREAPDVILLDMAMPGLDGIDVLLHLKQTPELDEVPVVMVTAHGDREHRLRALDAGADDFLEKPIDGAVLAARLKTLLRLKHSRDALVASHRELSTLHATLAERHEALVRLQRDHREFMLFVIHDLKNPLSTLALNLGYIQEEADDETIRECSFDSLSATHRLQQMVEDLLTIARLDGAVSVPMAREPIEVAELLAVVVRSYTRVAQAKSVDLIANVDREITIVGDRRILLRVLENLVENSLRYTPSRGRVAFESKQASDVLISVSNSGPAVPLEERDVIFEKFRRGGSDVQVTNHVGLGLYFCKRAVEAHGGEIGVVENDDYPTSFVIRLPLS